MHQNADLVTRKCALESQAQSKEKKISELSDRVKELQTIVTQHE